MNTAGRKAKKSTAIQICKSLFYLIYCSLNVKIHHPVFSKENDREWTHTFVYVVGYYMSGSTQFWCDGGRSTAAAHIHNRFPHTFVGIIQEIPSDRFYQAIQMYRIPLQTYKLKLVPRQCLSSRPVYGPVRVMKRPKFWSFSPKSAIWGQKSQLDFGSQAVLPTYLRVLQYKSSDRVIGLKACPSKSFNKYVKTSTVFLRRKSSQHTFKLVENFQSAFACASHIVEYTIL